MAGVLAAVAGYAATLAVLVSRGRVSSLTLLVCLLLALGWRFALVGLPHAWSSDALRYIWDARVQRAGLSPYDVRPDDEAVQALHTPVTRGVDAGWLPTIYPPVAQVYFRLVTSADESVRGFRLAAIACEIGIVLALLGILRATARKDVWVLVYAWHPLPPLEGALGAHLDFAGVLLLVLSWLALLQRRSMAAAAAFAAAVLVKPLPLVLAPLYWSRVRLRDAGAAVAATGLVTLWATRGGLPWGSMGTFVDDFRFNGPLFAMLSHIFPSRVLAGGAVAAGLVIAVILRRRLALADAAAWVWPMAGALVAAPVIYPWYLVWLVPFAAAGRAIPVWVWTVSVLAIYPTWHLSSRGAEFQVPDALTAVQFALPLLAALLVVASTGRPARSAR